jgi:hypothetical protein
LSSSKSIPNSPNGVSPSNWFYECWC